MSISLMVSFWASLPLSFLLCNCLDLSLFIFCGKSNKVKVNGFEWRTLQVMSHMLTAVFPEASF